MSSMIGFRAQAPSRDLGQELTGYWAADVWDLRMCPTSFPQGNLDAIRFLRFECPAHHVNTELKYVCRKKIIQGEWKVGKNVHDQIHLLVDWMKVCLPPSTGSLLERSLTDWEQSFGSYLTAQGRPVTRKDKFLLASQQYQEYTNAAESISLLRQVYRELEQTYDTRAEFDKDRWDFRQLGIEVGAASGRHKLNFTLIRQPWLKQLAKTCLRSRVRVYSAADCQQKLRALTGFSDFLTRCHPLAGPQQLTRMLMVEYFGFLLAKGLSPRTRGSLLTNLRTMLELAAHLGWSEIPQARVIYNEDLPKRNQPLPRFIPDQVLEQIFFHLPKLETRWQRMFLVAYEVGMRVGELLNLPFACLLPDATGGWWIQYLQEKGKTEHRQLISPETAALIQTQQQEIQAQFGHQPKWLFPNPKGNRFQAILFRNAINRFIIQNAIRDVSGTLWRFQPHQLRHTFGTRQINAGLSPTLLMRMMGHRQLQTSLRYARLHDHTLRAEFEKARLKHKLVDVTGRIIAEDSPVDAPDLQWLKSHLDARTLPNGFCGIPVALGPCPFPNGCLTCPHFRTDKTHLPTHEAQLAETSRLIQISRSKGWTTQTENNELIARNLKTIIASLKEQDDDSQT